MNHVGILTGNASHLLNNLQEQVKTTTISGGEGGGNLSWDVKRERNPWSTSWGELLGPKFERKSLLASIQMGVLIGEPEKPV